MGRTAGGQLAPFLSGPGTEIDEVVGLAHQQRMMADDDGRVAEEYFAEKLQADFGEYAGEQLDTAINWGRYAELFEFDDDTDELYLQSS